MAMAALVSFSSPSNLAFAHPEPLRSHLSFLPKLQSEQKVLPFPAAARSHVAFAAAAPSLTGVVLAPDAIGTNSELENLCKEGRIEATFQLLDEMDKRDAPISPVTCSALAPTRDRSISSGAPKGGRWALSSKPFLDQFAALCCKLGGAEEASLAFDEMPAGRGRRRRGSKGGGEADPKRREAHEKVQQLHEEMRAAGYVPDSEGAGADVPQRAPRHRVRPGVHATGHDDPGYEEPPHLRRLPHRRQAHLEAGAAGDHRAGQQAVPPLQGRNKRFHLCSCTFCTKELALFIERKTMMNRNKFTMKHRCVIQESRAIFESFLPLPSFPHK